MARPITAVQMAKAVVGDEVRFGLYPHNILLLSNECIYCSVILPSLLHILQEAVHKAVDLGEPVYPGQQLLGLLYVLPIH